jgi:glycosyltransferase involved in cell wall biosynthesis
LRRVSRTLREHSPALDRSFGVARTLAIAANGTWNIVNFREGLIRALRAQGYDPVVIAPEDEAAQERMAKLAVKLVPIRLSRSGLNPVADLRLLRSYSSILRRLRPAAFLGFTIKPNIYGCIAARLLGIPAIANISGLGTVFVRRGPLMRLVMAMYRFALRRASIVFFQNSDDLALFVGNGIVREGQARLLPGSGIDLGRFAGSPLPPGPPVFLLIARLLRDKGVPEFVEAAAALRGEFPEARFQLLGPLDPGNPTSIRQAELDRWVARGVVEYLGETDDVRPFIASATAVVLPTKYREGVPRSLLEGAAMGRPLVATDMPGCRDVVEDGVNGFLCEAGNVRSLAEAMRRIHLLTPGQRGEMGRAARTAAEQRFGEERVVRAYLDALAAVAPQAS